MKERPILFSGPMVRAILEGRKTVTRRVVKHAPAPWNTEHTAWDVTRCPYGQPGDRLWVREAWAETYVAQAPGDKWVVYRDCDNRTDYGGPWKPSIHMRRRDSRILLEVTAVRVERLHDISEEQAIAEGAEPYSVSSLGEDEIELVDAPLKEPGNHYRNGFAMLWESINGPVSWGANPWVWVIEFKPISISQR